MKITIRIATTRMTAGYAMAPFTLRRMASVFSRYVVSVSSTMGSEPLSSPARTIDT